MSVPLQMRVSPSDLARIVEDIFQTMLGMEATASAEAVETPEGPMVTACMHLAGAWNGFLVLQCRLSTACDYAAAMLGTERPATPDSQVKDAMGELVNMVAGNFKAALGGGSSYLSLLTVVEGTDYRFHILKGMLSLRMHFDTTAGPLWLSVVEISAADTD